VGSPPPSPTPEAWAQTGGYGRLVILQPRDTDPARRQVAASHLAVLGPYASAADGPAGQVIAQLYAAEAAELAGRPPAGEG
jgi:hypothetical protein